MSSEKEIFTSLFDGCSNCDEWLNGIGEEKEETIYKAMMLYHRNKSGNFKRDVIRHIIAYEKNQFDFNKLVDNINKL